MKTSILVDTDIIIQYLKTGKGVLPTAYEKYTMFISAATYTELLSSKTFNDNNLEKEVLEFVDKYFNVKEISKDIAHHAAKLVREHELNLTVSYIASTALTQEMELLTEDLKTFNKIPGIKFIQL